MSNINTYLNILLDSLDSKESILNNMYVVTKKQEELIKNSELDLEEFDDIIEEKQKYIDQIEFLDSGFQTTFNRIEKELEGKVVLYKEEIKQLKDKITTVSNIGINIQILEEKNKIKIEEHFASKRRQVKTFKKSKTTAANYYKNMSNSFKEQSFFLDKKK
ncbi:MAG: flagellar protein FlgN [Vallitalea sp.]|jgi:flagellar biosynthesis/type III secretory pathway chaperone|nr:flagellar protein FlgN [Vallitalea sp.]